MRLDQVLLVEAAANDLRGALTLVGANQRVLTFPALPFRVQLRAVLMFTDEMPDADGAAFEESRDIHVSINVIGPEGISGYISNQPVSLPAEKKWVDLPLMATIVADVIIAGDSYGIYLVEIRSAAVGQDEQVRRIPVYIVPQPEDLTPEVSTRAFPASQPGQAKLAEAAQSAELF